MTIRSEQSDAPPHSRGVDIRSVTTIAMPMDSFGLVVAPQRPSVYPPVGAHVRIVLPRGAADFTQDAIEGLLPVVIGCGVQVEGPDARLLKDFAAVLGRHMAARCEVDL